MPISLKANSDGSAEILNGVVSAITISSSGNVKANGMRGYNYIINGNFDIWQRGDSFTSAQYTSDRWFSGNVGSTKTVSKQLFALGQTEVPGNPTYFMRHIVNSIAGAGNTASMFQAIESVRTLAGKKATLSFYAKADSNKNIAVDFAQAFATGGTPSSTIVAIGAQLIPITTSWKKYVVTVDIPNIIGKTLGTNNNDCLYVSIWFDAGTSFNARTASLGHQSGTFDIACVSLVEGDVDIKPIPRSIGEELALCQRYYYTAMCILAALDFGGSFAVNHRSFPVTMRAVPVIAVTADGGTGGAFMAEDTNTFFQSSLHSVATTATIKADAEL